MAESNQAQIAQLGPGDLVGFEYISTRWDARIGQGIDPVELENPAFWAHQAMQLKPFDEIRARAEDGSWIGHYIVLDCSRNWAKVKLDRLINLTTADVSATQASKAALDPFLAQHKVLWRAARKFSVVRISDNSVLQEDIATRGEAQAWLENYARGQVPVVSKPETVGT